MGAQRADGARDWNQQDGPEPEQNPTPPWNLMIKHRPIQKRGRRSHLSVSYTDPQISMELLRAVLQPSLNQEILQVFSKYHQLLNKAAENVKENIGDEVQTDQLISETCRNALEHAKLLFPETEVKRPPPELKRHRDDESHRASPVPKKRKPRAGPVPDRPLSFSQVKVKAEPVKREGPKWDPNRLNDNSTFVLGSRANKALGMGGTRGRIYIKHSDLFKYAADAKDKQWLAERHHMRATGGKMAYLLIEQDIQDLAQSDEYKECPDVHMEEMKPFSVPVWMVEKMQRAMEAQRDAAADA
ncbi:deoxynucleotidyltransferase terminal-interacting protein 1 [Eucyclogobius newberryi]|uniref:deoxynucleotidyltransferase terminal-interacting protein 1 n=1 Tax=Eucyclogobius newberryi TaxID=166745 RepID=UPI003B5C46D5